MGIGRSSTNIIPQQNHLNLWPGARDSMGCCNMPLQSIKYIFPTKSIATWCMTWCASWIHTNQLFPQSYHQQLYRQQHLISKQNTKVLIPHFTLLQSPCLENNMWQKEVSVKGNKIKSFYKRKSSYIWGFFDHFIWNDIKKHLWTKPLVLTINSYWQDQYWLRDSWLVPW